MEHKTSIKNLYFNRRTVKIAIFTIPDFSSYRHFTPKMIIYTLQLNVSRKKNQKLRVIISKMR